MPGREAGVAEAASWVGEYPHGCGAQTTSKLIVHLAGQAPPFLLDVQVQFAGERLDAGLGLGQGLGAFDHLAFEALVGRVQGAVRAVAQAPLDMQQASDRREPHLRRSAGPRSN